MVRLLLAVSRFLGVLFVLCLFAQSGSAQGEEGRVHVGSACKPFQDTVLGWLDSAIRIECDYQLDRIQRGRNPKRMMQGHFVLDADSGIYMTLSDRMEMRLGDGQMRFMFQGREISMSEERFPKKEEWLSLFELDESSVVDSVYVDDLIIKLFMSSADEATRNRKIKEYADVELTFDRAERALGVIQMHDRQERYTRFTFLNRRIRRGARRAK